MMMRDSKGKPGGFRRTSLHRHWCPECERFQYRQYVEGLCRVCGEQLVRFGGVLDLDRKGKEVPR